MTWKNITVQRCKAVYDCLCKIYDASGTLPDGRVPKELVSTTGGEILDYGHRVAKDESVWDNLPEQLISSKEKKVKMAQTAEVLRGIPAIIGSDSSDEDIDSMLEEANEGQPREELRENLRNILNDCR